MACSPMPKVGGAAAPSAPPVPTSMVLLTYSFICYITIIMITLLVNDVNPKQCIK